MRLPRTGFRAFTLIEVMACLVIAAALATLAVANLHGVWRTNALKAGSAELESQDGLMRERCKRLGHAGQLAFDLDSGQVTRIEINSAGEEQRTVLPAFGDRVKVEAVLVNASGSKDRDAATVTCSALGRSASYAALLASGEQRQWIVVSGLTGMCETVYDRTQVQDIFLQLANQPRDDSH